MECDGAVQLHEVSAKDKVGTQTGHQCEMEIFIGSALDVRIHKTVTMRGNRFDRRSQGDMLSGWIDFQFQISCKFLVYKAPGAA